MDNSAHQKGFLITLFGVLVLTPDSLLVYLADVDPMAMSFWRGLFQSIVVTLALAILYKGKLLQNMLAIGKTGLIASAFLALCNISFVYSLETTGAANTLIIVATTSMWAALISIVML
ncbi:MAG: EamA/RhaT family transporter, partial [Alphaproteobacteria bacterium]|nr:EamA/RhaT family transporter [Alphaproteobacteria bacterium]